MIQLLRRLRRRLRLITYHSATRRRTVWTRLANGALVVTLLLSPPAMLLAEGATDRRVLEREIRGILLGDGDDVTAQVRRGERLWSDEVDPYGEWTVTVAERRRGWPTITRRGAGEPGIDVRLFDAVAPMRNGQVPGGSPVRTAIGAALSAAGEGAVAADVERGAAGPMRRHWFASVYASLLWWAALYGAAFLLIGAMRLAASVATGRRHGRRAERRSVNRCTACDYDLRGLEFHARCPECGTLIE